MGALPQSTVPGCSGRLVAALDRYDKGRTVTRRDAERFQASDWREIHTLYPNQWVAIEVEEVTPGVGITKGRIIARWKAEDKVVKQLDDFIVANPGKHFALVNPGRRLRPGEDMILGSD
jgi:hypothetical protein